MILLLIHHIPLLKYLNWKPVLAILGHRYGGKGWLILLIYILYKHSLQTVMDLSCTGNTHMCILFSSNPFWAWSFSIICIVLLKIFCLYLLLFLLLSHFLGQKASHAFKEYSLNQLWLQKKFLKIPYSLLF